MYIYVPNNLNNQLYKHRTCLCCVGRKGGETGEISCSLKQINLNGTSTLCIELGVGSSMS